MNTSLDRLIELYKDGCNIEYISKQLKISTNEAYQLLALFKKNETKESKRLTEKFKKIIAERNLNDISMSQISSELKMNAITVKRACDKYGLSISKNNKLNEEFTALDKEYDLSYCLNCNSKKVNFVDKNTIYCMNCSNEYFNKDGQTFKINWENLDE